MFNCCCGLINGQWMFNQKEIRELKVIFSNFVRSQKFMPPHGKSGKMLIKNFIGSDLKEGKIFLQENSRGDKNWSPSDKYEMPFLFFPSLPFVLHPCMSSKLLSLQVKNRTVKAFLEEKWVLYRKEEDSESKKVSSLIPLS